MRRLLERQKKRKNFLMKIYDIAPIDAYSEFLDGYLTVAMRAYSNVPDDAPKDRRVRYGLERFRF
jgi:hypothetical protein